MLPIYMDDIGTRMYAISCLPNDNTNNLTINMASITEWTSIQLIQGAYNPYFLLYNIILKCDTQGILSIKYR